MKLWAILISHSEVPGDHLIFMHQATEPTDEEVSGLLLRKEYPRSDLDCLTVTHCYDVEHWLAAYPESDAAFEAFAENRARGPR